MNSKQEKEFNDVSKTLNIELPFGNIPLPMKVVAFLTSAGGLSILANMISDFLRPPDTSFHFYILRIIAGGAMIAVGYGILKKQEWSIWIYGALSLISIFINPVLSVIPVCVTLYMISQRSYFKYGYFLNILGKEYSKLRTRNLPNFKKIVITIEQWYNQLIMNKKVQNIRGNKTFRIVVIIVLLVLVAYLYLN